MHVFFFFFSFFSSVNWGRIALDHSSTPEYCVRCALHTLRPLAVDKRHHVSELNLCQQICL